MALPPYRYTPLPSRRHIRLLTLETNAEGSTIVAQLHTQNIDEGIDFLALSYAWGASEQMKVVALDGSLILVGDSLYAGLKRLACRGLRSPIWIDAICINQDDLLEKAQQVPLMSEIYSRASSVLVWLEEASAAESQALSLLPTVLERLERAGPPTRLDASQFLADVALSMTLSELWTTYARILTRLWFNRLWVLQEVLLAVEVTILCGAIQLPWKDIERFERQVLRHSLHSVLCGSEYTSSQIYTALNIIANFSTCKAKMAASPDGSVPITTLLHIARRKNVTVLVDRVYGILSLVPKSVKRNVLVDYSLNPASVYAQFVRLFLQQDPMLELFSQVCGPGPGRMQGLPSWCLELDRQPPINRFGGSNGLASGYHAGFMGPFVEKILVNSVPGQATIKLHGLLIDKVAEKVDKVPTAFPPRLEKTSAASLVDWERKAFALAERNAKSEHWQKDYAYTLLAGRTLTQNNMYCKADSDLLDVYERYFKQIRDFAEFGKPRSHYIRYPVVDAMANRAFVATHRGRIGYAPSSVEPGDVVCIFQNSIVPFIVRFDVEGKPGKMIGEAYISSLMHGEALELEKRGEVKLVDIELD